MLFPIPKGSRSTKRMRTLGFLYSDSVVLVCVQSSFLEYLEPVRQYSGQ